MVLVQFNRGRRRFLEESVLLRYQHCFPDGRRTSIFEAQPAEVELALVDKAQLYTDRAGLDVLVTHVVVFTPCG